MNLFLPEERVESRLPMSVCLSVCLCVSLPGGVLAWGLTKRHCGAFMLVPSLSGPLFLHLQNGENPSMQ